MMSTPGVSDVSTLRACDVPFAEAVARTYSTKWWKPADVISIVGDALKLAAKWARRHTDQTCAELCGDELVARCRAKLIKLLQGDEKHVPILQRFTERGPLFGFLDACFQRDVCGVVHKNRFTMKRTGRRVPPKGSEETYDRGFKPEISLSDPDVSKSVERAVSCHDNVKSEELKGDMQRLLTPVEFLVFCELIEPSQATLVYSTLDAWRGPVRKLELNVKDIHRATALGISVAAYRAVSNRVKSKVRIYLMSDKAVELERGHHAAVSHLETIFGLQIPRSTEALTVKRLLTVAARANLEKVTPDIADLLRAVGARVPTVENNGKLQCYGVLYARNMSQCINCGLREACAVESANYGLDTITLSPKLLSAKALARTPSLTNEVPPSVPVSEAAPTTTVVRETAREIRAPLNTFEEELNTFLHDHFKPSKYGTELYFRHKEKHSKSRSNLLWLGRRDGKLTVRFCGPSDELRPLLERGGTSYYPPAEATIEQIKALVNQHATESLQLSSSSTVAPPAKPAPVAAKAILSKPPMTTAAPLSIDEDKKIEQYLHQHFKPAKFGPELYFRHPKRRADGAVQLFWYGKKKDRFCIRFCKPKEAVAARLEKIGTGYYPPASMGYEEIVELIHIHAEATAGDTPANFVPLKRHKPGTPAPATPSPAQAAQPAIPAAKPVVPRDTDVEARPAPEAPVAQTRKRRPAQPEAPTPAAPSAATPTDDLKILLASITKSLIDLNGSVAKVIEHASH